MSATVMARRPGEPTKQSKLNRNSGLLGRPSALIAMTVLCTVLASAVGVSVVAQPASTPKPSAQNTAVPSFWDPRRRPEKPDTSRVTLIRFMTEVDYPPFNYAGADGN